MGRMAQMECGANDKLNEWGVWLKSLVVVGVDEWLKGRVANYLCVYIVACARVPWGAMGGRWVRGQWAGVVRIGGGVGWRWRGR